MMIKKNVKNVSKIDCVKPVDTVETVDNSEDKIQARIVQELQKKGIFFCSIPNEGSLNKVRTMKLIGMGMRPGASDLVLILPEGKVLWVEVKNSTGKQSEKQEKFETRVTGLGHSYVLVRSWEELAIHLND